VKLLADRSGLMRLSRWVALILTAATIALAAPGVDNETRAAEWERRRREKAEHIEPPQQNRAEKLFADMEKGEKPSILQLSWKGIYPQFLTSINKNSRMAFGGRFWQPNIARKNWLDLHGSALFSVAAYKFIDLQVGSIPHAGRALPLRSTSDDDVFELGGLPRRDHFFPLILYGSFRLRDYTREPYYGLGADTSVDDQADYRLKDKFYEVVGGYQVSRQLSFSLRLAYIDPEVEDSTDDEVPGINEEYNELTAPGLTRQPDFLGYRGQIFLDLRDEPQNPHKGGMVAFQFSRMDDRGSSDFQFNRYSIDARGYLPLGSEQRILALRAYASHDNRDKGSRVPFYYMETLGGFRTLRGFRNFRFRDKNVVSLQAEYRWETIPMLELALMFDAGDVAPRFDDLSVSDLKTSYGAGLRIKLPDRVILRLSYFHSSEADRFLIRTGLSF